ncbi:hypothetical protein [Ponticaulis sp.]|uniref:hypothetical protein n=1 Tax=Ponticaulis sp. TaxID=2020902 RepID=UPI000B6F1B57|nr:hypothetical protein [Ponticaulis sp.]MAJ09702.1 hypothetical protein [Ponticaulis sp.]HBH89329.1 hypothetical protein [Hyphomonadaceae bacterium]HBJ91629.1 hypothetical protein [Hyphomonadaceae bacterium]|tara:strand:- start:20997 stop:21224 length:228 start_codon:yes stop_codon:yes gene_type:complete
MSDTKNWSPSYTAWKLMETILEGKNLKPTDLGKELLLDLYSDCVNSVAGDYVADIEDIDHELEAEDFEDDLDEDD